MVSQSNSAYEEQQWLADSGANAHITKQLDNLQIKQPFQQIEEVAVGNGGGLAIENIGYTFFHSHQSNFYLKYILHCP
jgi:hypothetical protein